MHPKHFFLTATAENGLMRYKPGLINRRVTQSVAQSYTEKDTLGPSAFPSAKLCVYLCAPLRLIKTITLAALHAVSTSQLRRSDMFIANRLP